MASSSLEITGKRELVRRSSWETSAHRRPGLLIDLATGIATWTSSTTLSTIVVALQDQPSENPIIRKWQKVATQPVEGASVQVIFACITLCSTIYAASCMRIYCTAPRAVATISAVCILLVFFEAVFNSLQVTLVERLAVVLPTLVNIGLSWTIVLRHRKRSDIALPSSKLDV